MRLDSHQHFWIYDPIPYDWINHEMAVLKRDFMPEDLMPLLLKNEIDGCVAVQAVQSVDETYFLLDLAAKYDFIKAVVGWVDLQSSNLEQELDKFSDSHKLKGFRHFIQSEPEVDFMLQPEFCRGVVLLGNYGYSYDLLILPGHLPVLPKFLDKFPDQSFVIDHLAKPSIKNGEISEWRKDLKQAAVFPNVYCKLSGMVTEAKQREWSIPDFKPYIDTVIECFGIERVMFGSDWPVCLTDALYDETCNILNENTIGLSTEEKDKLWGQNAGSFYKIDC